MPKVGQIQKVNPNPRPPNEPRIGNNYAPGQKGLASAQPAKAQGIAIGGNQVVNKPGPGNNLNRGVNSNSPAAPAPPSPGVAPAPDPRDSSYWEEIAQNNLTRIAMSNRLEESGQLDKSGYERNLHQLEYEAPNENRRLRENANVNGAIYSTSTREDEGNLAQQQYNRRAGLGEEFSQRQLERAKEKDLLDKEYGNGQNSNYGQLGINALKEAINRRVGEQANEPAVMENPQTVITKTIIKRIQNAKSKKKK